MKLADAVREDLCTFIIIFCPVLLSNKNVSDNTCIKNNFPANHFLDNKESMVDLDRPQTTVYYSIFMCSL
jgi:hypothetical protein